MNYEDEDFAKRLGTIAFVFSLVLTLIFVVSKINGNIDWSWIMVFIPLWAPISLGIITSIFK